MKRLIIGDIHGCYRELRDLLDAAGLAGNGEIIALGDIVDRGPDSLAVLDFFRTHSHTRSLQGNHERKHTLSFRGMTRPALSQLIARQQISEAEYPDAIRFMDALPRWIELPEAVLVHGMFERGLPLDRQRETVLVGTLSGEHYLAQRYDRPWYELYDGPKPLIVGHHDYLGNGQPLVCNDRVYGIDTGCCHGKALTGLLLPEFRFVSVPSRQNYWEEAQQQYYHLRYISTPVTDLPWEAAEAIVGAAERQTGLFKDASERAAQVKSMLAEAERCLHELLDHILGQNAQILADLRAQYPFDMLSPEKQGRLYAAHIGQTPLAAFLHRARKGNLELHDLRARFCKPAEVLEFPARCGIPNPGNVPAPRDENSWPAS